VQLEQQLQSTLKIVIHAQKICNAQSGGYGRSMNCAARLIDEVTFRIL
jgi:hypothetical protein